MKLKFDFISDIHADFWVKHKEDMSAFVDSIMPAEKSNILIVAGDISNDNDVSLSFFNDISARYDQVLYVLGNHDFYVNPPQRPNSIERVNMLRDATRNIGNVFHLDGNIHYVDGFAIGGTHMWYDGSYAKREFGFTDAQVYDLFRRVMNDYSLMTFDVFESEVIVAEKTRLWEIYKELDVIVTHVAPAIAPDLPMKWRAPETGFFAFDGEEFMDGPAKAWVYGHTHQAACFTHRGIDMLCNPLAYPGERPFAKIESWEIEK